MSKIPKKENALKEIFNIKKPLIGTVHCLPYPGSPHYEGQNIKEIIKHAVEEAKSYEEGGMDGVIIENEGDYPFLRPEDLGFETASMAAIITYAVSQVVDIPIGVNILANAAIASLAVAKTAGVSFVRVNQWANAYVANEGFLQGESAKALRYRKEIGGQDIKIFADVHVKHGSHAIVGDRPVSEQAGDIEFFDADVTIATGNRTGDPTPVSEVESIREGTFLPVIIGSGLTEKNAEKIMKAADGAIVGSSLKKEGKWWNNVEVERVKKLVAQVNKLR